MADYSRYTDNFQETRWASAEEIRSVTAEIDLTRPPYAAAGIPLINDGRTAWVDNSDNHSLIFGSTGSKKTRLFVMPMLNIMMNAGESFVVTDPKGELYERTSGQCREKGYNVVCLNFRDFGRSDCWNPLTLARQRYEDGDLNGASSVLNDLIMTISAPSRKKINDIFWAQSSESMLLGCALVLLATAGRDEVNMDSLVDMILDYGKGASETHLNEIVKYLYPFSSAAQNLKGVLGAPDKTWQSMFVSVYAMIKIFTLQKDLTRVLASDSFDMRSVGREKTAIYLVIPDEKETFHFLVSVFIKQCYETLIEEASRESSGMLPKRVNFVLDEFANIPKIDAMGAMISAARSRNMRFYLVIQSMAQLKKHYKEEAEVIKGNCADWCFLNSKELALLNEISEMCGEISVPVGGGMEKRRLISPSQLQRLDKEKGECLIFCQRQYPYLSRLADIDECVWPKGPEAVWPGTETKPVKQVSTEEILERLKDRFDLDELDETQLLFSPFAAPGTEAQQAVDEGRRDFNLAFYKMFRNIMED